MKKNYELLQQLLKKDSDEDDEKKNENNPNEDALLRNLGFHCGSSDRRGSKRSIDDKDDRDNKRSNSGSQVSSSGSSGKSEIYQKNKMLAFLLETPTPTPPTIPPIPASVISATPQEKLPRVMSDTPNKLMCATMAQNNIRHNNNNNNNNNNTNNNNNNRIISVRQQVNYLNNNNNNNNNFPRPVVSSLYNNNNNNNQIPPSAVENNLLCGDNNNIQGDPDLSDILDTVLDYFVPDSGTLQLLDANEGHPTNSSQLSEMAAIKNIQNSLMQCEKAVPSPNVSLPARPPAYNANVNVSTQNNNSGYPPPPTYPQQIKYSRAMRGSTGGQYSANLSNNPQLLVEQHRKLQRHAEEQRRRLLQQQKQQQLLIPSNATADMNSIQNIDNLLNNTVAPNVTLQRSNSVPESQLSPNYSNQLQNANSLNQNNQRGVPQPNSSQPYSPHAQMSSPLGQQNFQNQSANTGGNFNQQQRLSPQSQFNSQLSPRQTYSGQGNNGNSGNNANNWPQQQQQRLTVQNPMLNAQLTGTLIGRGNFQRPPSQQSQQQRNLSSPGGARHSPYGGDQFAPPTSPSGAFTQTQYLHRLQRANSVPTTSSPMPGGLGSPRPYPGNQNNNSPHHYSSNNPLQQQIIPSSNNPMMYASSHQSASQESNYNCYDQQQQQHQQQQHQQNMSGYERRSSVPSAHHLPAGVAGSNPTSEFVRQELRAVVGARTAQAQPGAGGQQQQQRSGPSPAQQLQQISQQASNTVDLESLGINFEMAPGASDSPKLWGSIGTEMGSMSPQPPTSRTTMEEGRQGDHAKTSLLQQLLSDQSK